MGKEPPPIIDADFEVVDGSERPVPRGLEPGEAMFNGLFHPENFSRNPYRRSVEAVVLGAILFGMLYGAIQLFKVLAGA